MSTPPREARARALGFESDDAFYDWWGMRYHQSLYLALEIAGRDQGGWANCHEIANVMRRSKSESRGMTDPAFLSVSILSPECKPTKYNDGKPAVEKRRRIGAGLVDYRLTPKGREIMKRGMSL